MNNNPDTLKKRKQSSLFLIIGVLLIFFSTIFISTGLSLYNSEQRFDTESIETVATVTKKSVSENRSKNSSGKTEVSTTYFIHYNFQTKNGQLIASEDSVNKDQWDAIDTGTSLQIQYLEGEPVKSRMTRKSSYTSGFIFMAIGALLIVTGLGAIAYFIQQRLFANRLLKSGCVAEATITSVRRTSVSINDESQWVIEYKYSDMRGGSFHGKSPYLSPAEAELWHNGDKCKIRYDREKPKRSLWIGN